MRFVNAAFLTMRTRYGHSMPPHITLQADIRISKETRRRSRARGRCAEPVFVATLRDMTNTQSLPASVEAPASSKQYSLKKILGHP